MTSSLFQSRKPMCGLAPHSDKGRVEAPLWQNFSARFVTSVEIRHGEREGSRARSSTWSSAGRFVDTAYNDRGGTLSKASARGQSLAIIVATEDWIPLYECCLPEDNDRR
jgi:hypothetical protein